ncbi:secreted protein C [Diprion similis]|uniref:secreted protein C n=1 Tax=Diprion similis TaxID=362088 RepID=UPI001EF7FEDA|nr:secreted protein C [Diprion similis]
MADPEIAAFASVQAPLLVCGISIILGAIGLVVAYLINRPNERSEGGSKTVENSTSTCSSQKETVNEPVGNVTAKRGKNKKRREAQQEFTHSWMVGALKGHTAPVLDMDYASNGKFLASCAEDCDFAPEELDPGGDCGGDGDGEDGVPIIGGESRSECSGSLPVSSRSKPGVGDVASPTPAKRNRKILSRRQRKNRTRTPRDVEVASPIASSSNSNNSSKNSSNSSSSSSSGSSSGNSSGGETSSGSPSSTPPGIRRNRPSGATDAGGASGGGAAVGGRNGNCALGKNRKSQAGQAEDHHDASKLYAKLNLRDAEIEALLRHYVIPYDQLIAMGYPIEGAECPGRAIIFKDEINFRAPPNLDANAREFVPARGKTYSEIAASWTAERADRAERSEDSGHCSASSLESSDVEPESSDCSDKASDIADGGSPLGNSSSSASSSSSDIAYGGLERTCTRCSRGFQVSWDTGEYLSTERCVYHWGKLSNRKWACCGAGEVAGGCTSAKFHVWTGLTPGINGPIGGYVHTRPKKTPPPDRCYGIYALDCEMCFTRNGLELAKVTVVGIDGKLVYDTLVKPEAEIIDYNTRFSGITAKDLARSPKSLRDVQSDIMGFVNADTVLIGHGLENDLRALRIFHFTCVDTGVAFPHQFGLPFRRSLKSLARALLRRDIQTGHHDSLEDARTAAELMLWRLRRDLTDRIISR